MSNDRPSPDARWTVGRQPPSRLRTSLSDRDLAVLRAVAAGRCEMSTACGGSLTVDGLCCCDQFVGPRLANSGLIAAPGLRLGPARLTASGNALLGLAWDLHSHGTVRTSAGSPPTPLAPG